MIQDFTRGDITRQLLKFAAPLFLSNMLQIVYNMVDMIIVGQTLGAIGLSAVAIGGDVANFLTFVAMGFSGAGQVIIAQLLGAGQRAQLGRFISNMVGFQLMLSVGFSLMCLTAREPILRLMNTPPETWDEALAYATVTISGLIFIYGYNTLSAVLRGLGDSKHPFIFVSISAMLNIILDLIFVIGLEFGAKGAALATVLSQCVSFSMCGTFLYRHRAEIGVEFRVRDFVTFDRELMSRLLKLGIPMSIKSASIHFTKLFVASWLNSFGVAVAAFAGLANKINSTAMLMSGALNTAGAYRRGALRSSAVDIDCVVQNCIVDSGGVIDCDDEFPDGDLRRVHRRGGGIERGHGVFADSGTDIFRECVSMSDERFDQRERALLFKFHDGVVRRDCDARGAERPFRIVF